MTEKNLLTPLLRTLDKVLLGLEDADYRENSNDFIELDNEEEFDVTRSIN